MELTKYFREQLKQAVLDAQEAESEIFRLIELRRQQLIYIQQTIFPIRLGINSSRGLTIYRSETIDFYYVEDAKKKKAMF